MSVPKGAARRWRILPGRLEAALLTAAMAAAARGVRVAAPALLPASVFVAAGCTAGPGGMAMGADLGAADAAPDSAEPPATPSAWTAEHPQPTGNSLRAVSASGSLAYAVGELGTVVRISSGAPAVVTEAEGLTRATLNAVTAVGEIVWAVGDDGTVLRRQGGTWSRLHLGAENLYTVFSDSTGAVYAAGQGEALWKFDGVAWSRSSLPGQTAADATYAGAAQGDLLFLAGSSGRILRSARQGGGWLRESDGLTALPLRALLLRPDGGGFAVGDGGAILRRDPAGPRWSLDLGAANPPAVALRAVFASRDALYAVTETGLTLHRGGAGWEPTGDVAVGRVWAGSGDDSGAFIVGDTGQIWRRGPQSSDVWQSALPVSTLTRSDVTAIADAGDGSLYATSEDGLILRRASSGAWAIDGRAPLAQPLYAIWAAGEEAYAVGSGGTILQRQTVGNWQPVRYAYPELQISWRGVSAIGATGGGGPQREVLVVGAAVNNLGEQVAAILRGVPATGAWVPEPLDTRISEPLYAVAGNDSVLLAVGGGGTVVRRDHGRWIREGAEIGSDVQLLALTVLGGAADADFYAAGTRGGLYFRDGKTAPSTWTRLTPLAAPGLGMLGGVAELAGELWVAGSGGFISHRSADGSWRAEPTPTRANLRGLLASGSTLFAAGQGGLILRRRAPTPQP